MKHAKHFRFSDETLARLDASAQRRGLTRTAMLELLVALCAEADERGDVWLTPQTFDAPSRSMARRLAVQKAQERGR